MATNALGLNRTNEDLDTENHEITNIAAEYRLTNRSLTACNWSESDEKITLVFEESLSVDDKAELDQIVSECTT